MSISKHSGQTIADIMPLLQCPTTGKTLVWDGKRRCTSEAADGQAIEYPVVNGQLVLVDFEESILDRSETVTREAASVIEDRPERKSFVKRILLGENEVATKNAALLLERIRVKGEESVVLIVCGGSINVGASDLYAADGVRIIAFDIYSSANTDFVADAHAIPLRDNSVDAVWIQAVLEHVLTPATVADEIWRVLKPGGIVYAETPFLQPVHEAGYDFTRFTESGHRRLFRKFDLIDCGVVRGPGTVLFQILRYALGAAFGNRRLGSRIAAPFFWLRLFDRLADSAHARDAASATYFLGTRSDTRLRPRDMPGFHRGVRN
ncbi:class I SAM-dependent methyltransferase [Maritimibacter sp. 55A14]|uniref:class I SAM-dependent methyltransferase n=1 Tax=Maritimibacter sp. 55A14 TaxID=2174844 RepID=UPI001304F763|nr:class I SAM-dependent methyltransferase [Maritimibacter sp. 55A14]